MSGEEEGKEKTVEENVDVEQAVSFFRGLLAYFKQNPRGLTALLHNVSENLISEIIENGELSKMLGYVAGQLNVISDLIWNYDNEEVVQHALTNSPNLEDVLSAIAHLAWAYARLESSTEIIPGDIENLIKESASTLYRIIEYIIKDIDCDP